MGRPLFFVENFYSSTQFPAHVVSASSEEASYESWRVGTGRRSRQDRWMPTALDTAAWIRVDCAQARPATMVAIDRGHNLAGVQIKIQGSADAVAWTDVLTATIPAAAAVAGDIDAANGITTEESAWLRRFASASYRYWRLWIPAMGAGLRPEVVGLWVGTSWTPELYFDLPWSEEGRFLQAEQSESDAGWVGIGQLKRGRSGEIDLKLRSETEYSDEARYHIATHFWSRRPMWIVYDDEATERAVLAVPRLGDVGFGRQQGWGPRQSRIAWLEHEAKP